MLLPEFKWSTADGIASIPSNLFGSTMTCSRVHTHSLLSILTVLVMTIQPFPLEDYMQAEISHQATTHEIRGRIETCDPREWPDQGPLSLSAAVSYHTILISSCIFLIHKWKIVYNCRTSGTSVACIWKFNKATAFATALFLSHRAREHLRAHMRVWIHVCARARARALTCNSMLSGGWMSRGYNWTDLKQFRRNVFFHTCSCPDSVRVISCARCEFKCCA